tara:strand:+ start:557 stop:820 length:264 start_codon:yes stop_codon:yes gene_type:complete
MTKLEKNNQIPSKVAKLTFEEALLELEDIVAQLEGGKVSLEESIDIYTRGTYLRIHCENKLKDAQEKIEKIIPAVDGSLTSEEVDLD